MSSLCGGSGEWGRGLFKCPFCLERRRGLMALVYGGYGSNAVCGGCGSRFSDGEGRFESNHERAEEGRAFVRETWKRARPWRAITREVYEAHRQAAEE